MIKIGILLFIAVLQVSLGLSLRLQRDLNTTDLLTFDKYESKDNTNSNVSQSLTSLSRKPAKNTTKAESYPNGIDALVSLLNSTLFEFNSEISRAIQNASGHNTEESEQLSRLVQNVQTFLKNQSASLPTRNLTGELGLSLINFKTVLEDSQEQLNSSLIRLNHGNFTLATRADAGNGNATNGHREGKGLIDSFMQISSQVGQGLRANIRDAEDVVQSTVQQVQSQVQSFVSGVNSFVNDASSALSLPNIFNFTMPNIFHK